MKLNEYRAIGNLTRDSEIITMSNGKPKQVFTIAVNDDYKKVGTEEWIKRPYFIDCYVIGKQYKDLKKGRKVLINGKIVTRNYEQNGAKKKITLVEVFALDFMVQKENGNDFTEKAEVNGNIKDMSSEEVPF